ncbi:hypothetical protein QF032_004972 [Streptomyces achromogenes]|nr:hypothetical protein [Streptomyces achromogenes]
MRSGWTIRCGALTTLALLTGCSDKPSLRESYPVQWQACDTLYGSKNMKLVRDGDGSDGLRFTNEPLSVDGLRNELVEEVVNWSPNRKYYSLKEYQPCALSGDSGLSSTVEWAKDNLKAVRSASSPWRPAGGDVYADHHHSASGRDTDAIFPCKISGTDGAQEARIPLEVRVRTRALKVSADLHERLVVTLARSLRNELKCTNAPQIPDDLALSEE